MLDNMTQQSTLCLDPELTSNRHARIQERTSIRPCMLALPRLEETHKIIGSILLSHFETASLNLTSRCGSQAWVTCLFEVLPPNTGEHDSTIVGCRRQTPQFHWYRSDLPLRLLSCHSPRHAKSPLSHTCVRSVRRSSVLIRLR